MVYENSQSVYACLNYGEAYSPNEIADRSICINGDIGETLIRLQSVWKEETQCKYVALTGMTGTDFFHSKMLSVRGKIKNSSASTRAQENIRTFQQNRQFGLPSPLEMWKRRKAVTILVFI